MGIILNKAALKYWRNKRELEAVEKVREEAATAIFANLVTNKEKLMRELLKVAAYDPALALQSFNELIRGVNMTPDQHSYLMHVMQQEFIAQRQGASTPRLFKLDHEPG
jgi:hypothetical protein